MSTNYYLLENVCQHCKRPERTLHVGKSSVGWCFSLHVIPEEGLNDLPDWVSRFEKEENVIKDEYDKDVTTNEMIRVITKRYGIPGKNFNYKSNAYKGNHAEPGPNNLIRNVIGQYCVGHGNGTWDLIPGEFS